MKHLFVTLAALFYLSAAHAQTLPASLSFDPISVNSIAGIREGGLADGPASTAKFSSPAGVAFSGGNLYVADRGNNRIRKVSAGGMVTTIAGSDTRGFTDGPVATATFNSPAAITADPAGNLYVLDIENKAIRKISTAGIVSTIAVAGVGSASGHQFTNGLAIDASGNVYVIDNLEILKITASGAISEFAGNNNGPQLFSAPRNIQFDLARNLCVQQVYGQTLKISPAGVISTLPFTTNFSSSLATDKKGNLYLFGVDVTGLPNLYPINKLSPASNISFMAGGAFGDQNGIGSNAQLGSINGSTACDDAGNIYFADVSNNRIRKASPPDLRLVTSANLASAAAYFSISGIALNSAASVQSTANYELSLNESGPWSPSLSVAPTGTEINAKKIYIRLTRGLAAGDYNGVITIAGGGAPNQALAVSGVVNQTNTAPVANAGTDRTITLPDSSITLDASESYDTDGSIVQYYWSQAKGPVQAVISNHFARTPVATGLNTAGKYVFVLQVKDNAGAQAYAQKVVTVDPAIIKPPCVNLLSPQNGATVPTQKTAVLRWEASPGAISYDVYFLVGTSANVSYLANTYDLAYQLPEFLSPGTIYSWAIVPKSANGANIDCAVSKVRTFTTAPLVNVPIVPNAGGSATITLPEHTALLDASASTGSIVEYYWYQVKGPVQAAIGDNFNVVTTAAGLTTAGTYTFGLQVKDNNGTVKYATKTVTVLPATAPAIPACANNVSPANGSTVLSSTIATLSWNTVANASSYDVYLWTGASAPASPVANTTNLSYGATGLAPTTTYNWYVIPKNASGSASGCDLNSKWSFTTYRLTPTCVTNISPAANSVLSTSTTATLTWPASPGATRYDVYLNAGTGAPSALLGSTTELSYAVTGLNPGTVYSWYILPWSSFIGDNYSCSSNTTKFYTAVAGNQPLVANAGGNNSFPLPYSLTYLDGRASTGNIVEFYWYQVSGPVQVTIDNRFSAMTRATGFTAAGTYTFGLQVKDNMGIQKYAAKTVTVTEAMAAAARMTEGSPLSGNQELTKAGNASLPSISAAIGPNPVRTGQTATLQISSSKPGPVMVNTITSTGVIIASKKLNLVTGVNTTTVSTTGLAQGFHFISISGASKPLNLKLVVQ